MIRTAHSVASILGLTILVVSGCGEDPIVTSTRNLERPADMGFVCLASRPGPEGKPLVSGRPMAECRPPDGQDPEIDRREPRAMGTFALVTNTGRGEVAVIDLDPPERLIDVDPANPGFSQVPVGSLPEAISVSQDGCRAVTANRGSCDFGLLDPARLLAHHFAAGEASTGADGAVVRRVKPKTGNGRLLQAAPFEVTFLPTPGQSGAGAPPLCSAEGAREGDQVVPWRAIATFPACDLVALIDFPSGEIVSSVRIKPDGTVESAGRNPECPLECADGQTLVQAELLDAPFDGGSPVEAGVAGADGGADAGAVVEAGAADGGKGDAMGPEAGHGMPVHMGPFGAAPLAVVPEGTRVYVGGVRAPFLLALGITREGLEILPGGGKIPLYEDPGGVTRLRLSIDPFALRDGRQGRFVGSRGEFLYAFARDGSVRVVDVRLRGQVDEREQECDVNIDPASYQTEADAKTGCFPLVASQGTRTRWTRRPLAKGPGLRIPVTSAVSVPPPLPRDIAFINLGTYAIGYLLTSNGQVLLVTLDAPPGERDATHSFRNVGAPPQVAGEPGRSFTTSEIPFATKVTPPNRFAGPRLEGARVGVGNIFDWASFPRPDRVNQQSWGITWEGILPGSRRLSGVLEAAGASSGPGGALSDIGADFCRAGVEPGDVLALTGCDQDIDCDPTGRSAVCHRTTPGNPGLCLSRDRVRDEELMRQCSRHLGSRRRYEVLEATRTRLVLGPKLDEVPRPAVMTCTKDEDCQPGPSHMANPNVSGDRGFQCLEVRPGELRRCVKRCGVEDVDGRPVPNDRACRAGHVCEDVGSPLGPLCVEAPPSDERCWPEVVRYQVQAGKSYLVNGSESPYLPNVTEARAAGQEVGRCERDETQHPLLAHRIPLSAPRCKTVADGETAATALVQSPDAEEGRGNPCLFLGPNGDESGPGAGTETHVKALFENPELRFVATNLEQYPGDSVSMLLHVVGGQKIERVSSTDPQSVFVSLGVRIVTSPVDAQRPSGTAPGPVSEDGLPPYLFVIDQGRNLPVGSRGQIVRLNPRPTPSHPAGRYDSAYTRSTFPIQ
jgi:hypothetical protein